MKYYFKPVMIALVLNCSLHKNILAQPLQAYFDRFYPAQPNVRYGGMAVCVAVNPSNDNEIIAATHSGGLMKTTDRAVSWRNLFNLPPHYVTFVQYAPGNTNNIIATTIDYYSVSPRGGIWLSRNGGETWEQPSGCIPPGIPAGARLEAYCVATFPGSTRILAGTNYGLAISDDNGITWTYQSVPGTSVYAVALLRDNSMVIGTGAGIYYWNVATSSWNHERTGIGMAFGYNALHVPKQFMTDVTTNKPIFVITSAGLIQFSNNGGRNWSLVDTLPSPISGSAKGTLFVRIAKPGFRIGGDGVDLYVTNKYGVFRKFCPKTGANFSYNFNERWQGMLGQQHSDISDLSLDREGNPFLLGGDGGVQKFWRDVFGDNFSFNGGGYSGNGFHGLQVTEVSGMYVNSRTNYDMYFATQDNDLFASEDLGRNWNFNTRFEGFFLEHARRVANEDDADLGYVACSGCSNNFTTRLFRTARAIIPPPGTNPTALKYLNTNTWLSFTYSDNASPGVAPTMASTTYWYTTNYSAPDRTPGWSSLSTLSNFVPRSLPRFSGAGSEHIAYQAYKAVSDAGDDVGGTDGSGIQRVKLMRMHLQIESGYFYSAPRFPAMRNFGSIGVFPTEFAWYEVFAPDPVNPQHIIAADALNNKMMRSLNGGDDWFEMTQLTNLVTASGAQKFKYGRLTNVSCISFNPDYPQMVLVGTRNTGIFFSWNNGVYWEKIPGSERIPEVSSFYFENHNKVWVSSYGRGLWKLEFSYRARRTSLLNFCSNGQCAFLLRPDLFTTLMQSQGAGGGFDQAMMLADGTITGMLVHNGIVENVVYTPGTSLIWYTDEKKIDPSIKMETSDNTANKGFSGIDKIDELAKQGYVIKGILLKGNQLVDVVYGKEPSAFPGDIKKEDYIEVGTKEPETQGKAFILLSCNNMMNGYCTVKTGEKMILRGINFDKNSPSPLQVMVDDKPPNNIKLEKLEADGSFFVEFFAEFQQGYHTITVNQYTAEKKLISQTDEFMVTHADEAQLQQIQEQKSPQKQPAIKEKAAELKNEIEKIVNPKKNNKGE